MRYFRLMQEQREKTGLIFSAGSANDMRKVAQGDLSLLGNMTVVFADSLKESLFAKLLDRQVFMFQQEIKDVFEIYLPEAEYKNFCILDKQIDQHRYYFAPVLETLDVLPEGDGENQEMSLSADALEQYGQPDIFRVHFKREQITAISLPAAESLLRRKIPDIRIIQIGMQ